MSVKKTCVVMLDPVDQKWKRSPKGDMTKANAKLYVEELLADGIAAQYVVSQYADAIIRQLEEKKAQPDLNDPVVLFRILHALQYSVESPLGNLQNKKSCPYCGHLEGSHDVLCKLNDALLRMIMNDREGIVAEMQQVLKDLHRIDNRGFYIGPAPI